MNGTNAALRRGLALAGSAAVLGLGAACATGAPERAAGAEPTRVVLPGPVAAGRPPLTVPVLAGTSTAAATGGKPAPARRYGPSTGVAAVPTGSPLPSPVPSPRGTRNPFAVPSSLPAQEPAGEPYVPAPPVSRTGRNPFAPPSTPPTTPATAPATAAPGGPAPARQPLVGPGSAGPAVRALQAALRDRGWRLAVDGVYGRRTTAAVRAFQAQQGIAVDGLTGPQTWTAVRRTDG